MRKLWIVPVLVLSLSLPACGSDGSSGSNTGGTTVDSAPEATASTEAATTTTEDPDAAESDFLLKASCEMTYKVACRYSRAEHDWIPRD